ncbi:pentapeptide repeat-containing protein [Halococcus sediminicola]|uniref:pentapeptide repeat-containing protein n=1 Tax=Halococcus sediminicola TaxID=1264579 RepID=UPI000AD03DB6|nr:pentapeptide repeat-containing protein [Halococcus sediminicola]
MNNSGMMITSTDEGSSIPGGRCGYSFEGDSEAIGAYSCWRPSWQDTGRCVWHAERANKPPSVLAAARTDYPERLDGAYLRNASIDSNVSFADCTLRNACLTNANLQNIDCSRADFSGANCIGCDLSDSVLDAACIDGATLDRADFSHVSGAEATLVDATLVGADLSHARFEEADLSEADFTDATLSNTTLRRARLCEARFVDATLKETLLVKTDLSEANLEYAAMIRTDLRGADLTGVHFYGTVHDNCRIDHRTTLDGVCSYEQMVPEGTSLRTVVTDGDVDLLDKAIWTYGALQTISRENKLNQQASDYYVRQHDTQRRQVRARGQYLRWAKAEGARWVMQYGEGIWNVVYTALAVIVLSTLLYPLSVVGGLRRPSSGAVLTYATGGSLDLLTITGLGNLLSVLAESFYFSVVTFTTLGYGDWIPLGYSKGIAMAESLIGTFIVSILIYVLARRVMW